MPKKDASPLEGRVIKIIGPDRIVINVGLNKGANPGDIFVVFEAGEEILDPETNESLGQLERVKGTFVADHVQALMSQLSPRGKEKAKGNGKDSRVLSAVMADTGSHAPIRTRNRPNVVRVGDLLRRLPGGGN